MEGVSENVPEQKPCTQGPVQGCARARQHKESQRFRVNVNHPRPEPGCKKADRGSHQGTNCRYFGPRRQPSIVCKRICKLRAPSIQERWKLDRPELHPYDSCQQVPPGKRRTFVVRRCSSSLLHIYLFS